MNKNKSGSTDSLLSAIVIIFLLILIAIFSFAPSEENKYGPQQKENDLIGRIVKFEGCEYIEQRTAYKYHVWEHKGNCSNPIHKYSQERAEP